MEMCEWFIVSQVLGHAASRTSGTGLALRLSGLPPQGAGASQETGARRGVPDQELGSTKAIGFAEDANPMTPEERRRRADAKTPWKRRRTRDHDQSQYISDDRLASLVRPIWRAANTRPKR